MWVKAPAVASTALSDAKRAGSAHLNPSSSAGTPPAAGLQIIWPLESPLLGDRHNHSGMFPSPTSHTGCAKTVFGTLQCRTVHELHDTVCSCGRKAEAPAVLQHLIIDPAPSYAGQVCMTQCALPHRPDTASMACMLTLLNQGYGHVDVSSHSRSPHQSHGQTLWNMSKTDMMGCADMTSINAKTTTA